MQALLDMVNDINTMRDYYYVSDTLSTIKLEKDLENAMETVNQLIFDEEFYSVKASLDEFAVSEAIDELVTFEWANMI